LLAFIVMIRHLTPSCATSRLTCIKATSNYSKPAA